MATVCTWTYRGGTVKDQAQARRRIQTTNNINAMPHSVKCDTFKKELDIVYVRNINAI